MLTYFIQTKIGGSDRTHRDCIAAPNPQIPWFTFSDSAMKKRFSFAVETSKANGLLMASSAPLMDRHLLIYGRRQNRNEQRHPAHHQK